MELDTTKKYLLSKEGMLSSENLYLIEDGLKTKMFGLLTMILNGQQESVISTLLGLNMLKESITLIITIILLVNMASPED